MKFISDIALVTGLNKFQQVLVGHTIAVLLFIRMVRHFTLKSKKHFIKLFQHMIQSLMNLICSNQI